MRVVLFGGAGLLGSALAETAPPHVVLTRLRRADADLRDPAALAARLDEARPDWVINAAAFTNVDAAETDREAAREVNADAVGRLGTECARRGTRVLHYSTDYVFAGAPTALREDDAPAPLNHYGDTKLAGERLLLAAAPLALVARVQWLFAPNRACFVRLMLERARAALPTRVVNDQVGRPARAEDVARASWALLDASAQGVVHVTSEGPPTSRFALAQRIFGFAGAAALVTPCASADVPAAARRPERSVLDGARLAGILGQGLPDWRDSLDAALRDDAA